MIQSKVHTKTKNNSNHIETKNNKTKKSVRGLMVSYLILASYLDVHYLSNHKPVSPKKQKKYDIVPTIEQGKIQQGG
jgi:hypothetical protein